MKNQVQSGKVLTFLESVLVHPSHAGGLVHAGDPCVVGRLIGVATETASSSADSIDLESDGVFSLSVLAKHAGGINDAVSVGDQLYIDATTAAISKDATGVPFGVALAVVVSGATTTIPVLPVQAVGAAGATASSGPDTPPASPNAMDDEFTAGVLDVKWTKRNFANTAAAVPSVNPFDSTTGRLRFTCRNDGLKWALITQPITGVFSVATKTWLQGSRNNYNTCGLAVMNTVNGKFANFGLFTENPNGSGDTAGIEVQEWTDVDTFSADVYADHMGYTPTPVYLKIDSDGTTLTFSNSYDGILYSPVFTRAIATFLGSVNAIGLSTWGPQQPAPNGVITFDAIYQWFRRLA